MSDRSALGAARRHGVSADLDAQGRRRGAGARCGEALLRPPPAPRPTRDRARRAGRGRAHAGRGVGAGARRGRAGPARGQVRRRRSAGRGALAQPPAGPGPRPRAPQRAAYDDAARRAARQQAAALPDDPAWPHGATASPPVHAGCSAPTPSCVEVPRRRASPRSRARRVDLTVSSLAEAALVGARAGGGAAVGGATGHVVRVNGPLVDVEGLQGAAMSELVELGPLRLLGRGRRDPDGDRARTVQAYEYTGGLAPRRARRAGGRTRCRPRSGPGLLGGVFDGLLRPLATRRHLARARATAARPTDPRRRGGSRPTGRAPGTTCRRRRRCSAPCDGAGPLPHRVLVPPGVRGPVAAVARRRAGTGADAGRARSAASPVPLSPALAGPPAAAVRERLDARTPAAAPGQRVLDLLLPVARGQHRRGARRLRHRQDHAAAADRQVVRRRRHRLRRLRRARQRDGRRRSPSWPRSTDPRTGGRLADRTVIIANTSNMPMMAREASIYTGVTVAEYFRDMGYDAVVIADSTSRWAEALREFASRSGALPAEEGYPADLASALAAFYERAGRVTTLGGATRLGHRSSARSPRRAATLTEPVTAHTQRFVRAVWTPGPGPRLRPALPRGGLGRLVLPGRRRARPAGTPGTATRPGRRRRARVAGAAGRGRPAGRAGRPRRRRRPAAATSGWSLLGGRLLREGVLQQSALSQQRRVLRGRQARRGAGRRRCSPSSTAARQLVGRRRPPRPASRSSTSRPLLRARRRPAPDDADAACGAAARDAVLAAAGGAADDDRPGRPRVEHSGADASCAARCWWSAASRGVGWDEFARRPAGRRARIRHGLVLEVDGDLAVVQVLEGTDGIEPAARRVVVRRLAAAGPGR